MTAPLGFTVTKRGCSTTHAADRAWTVRFVPQGQLHARVKPAPWARTVSTASRSAVQRDDLTHYLAVRSPPCAFHALLGRTAPSLVPSMARLASPVYHLKTQSLVHPLVGRV
jgi:hypothetical protein